MCTLRANAIVASVMKIKIRARKIVLEI